MQRISISDLIITDKRIKNIRNNIIEYDNKNILFKSSNGIRIKIKHNNNIVYSEYIILMFRDEELLEAYKTHDYELTIDLLLNLI